jgi:predicted DCC family thiol-disulfide oxidoreductase YuxK
MRTLKEHVILYDGVCPLCNVYTNAFVKYKFLDQNGRTTYQNMPSSIASCVDSQKAVNEIALVNKRTGDVAYGVKSLMKILAYRFPILKSVFEVRFINWLATKAYRFVSYNRRIVMPPKNEQLPEHEPSLHKGYRILYLILTWIFTALVLNAYSKTLNTILPPSNLVRELVICGGQIIWQGLFIYYLKKEKAWTYLGNLMTISFAGALVLCLGLISNSIFSISNSYWFLGFFTLVVGLMFLEHIRRTRVLNLPWILTASWVAYRCIALIFIL